MAYNPGIQSDIGPLISGIAGAGKSIGAGLGSIVERYQKQKDEEKSRAREYKALQEYADVSGFASKDQTTVMDLDTLKGLVRGKEMDAIRKQNAAKLEQEDAQTQLVREHLADMAGERQRQRGYNDESAVLLSGMDAEDAPAPLQPGNMSALADYARNNPGAAGRRGTPALTPELADQLRMVAAKYARPADAARILTEWDVANKSAGGMNPALDFQEDPLTGSRFAKYGRQLMPSGVNPAKVPSAQEMVDEEGNPTGMWAAPGPKGSVRLVKGMSAAQQGKLDAGTIAQLQAAKHNTLNRIAGLKSDLADYGKDAKGYLKSGRIVPDAKELADAQADLEQVNGQLRGVGTGGGAASGAPAAKAGAPNKGAEEQSRANAKAAIARNPQYREAILQRLKASGYRTDGL